MVGTISPVVGSLIQIGGVSFTLPTQGSSNTILIQFIGVFLGALLAGVINYRLQNRLLRKQREESDMTRRKDAYSALLDDIMNYLYHGGSQHFLRPSLERVKLYGSDKVRLKAELAITKIQNSTSEGMRELIPELRESMEEELKQGRLWD